MSAADPELLVVAESGSSVPAHGYVYVALGATFYAEAARSALSLKRFDHAAHITLICAGSDAETYRVDSNQPFHRLVGVSSNAEAADWKHGLLFKTRNLYQHTPYDHAFFIDSDTLFLDDCSGLFRLLEYYDLALAHGTNDRHSVSVDGRRVPGCTPYNSGVMLFRKNRATAELFASWHSVYERSLSQLPHDQPALMEALAKSPCRVYVFQNNWNARFFFPEKYAGPVHILHGRHARLEHIAERINATTEARLWLPRAETVVVPGLRPANLKTGLLAGIRWLASYGRHWAGRIWRKLARVFGAKG